ncbi:DUF4760 domain-containing protein [Flagellimonas nanhaiensis]|nr:DUF4760 domain-containing protein [Allomuricauda nanhaiensis]
MKVVLDAREKFKLSNNELKKEIGNKELSSLDVEEIFTSKSQIVLKIRDLLGIFENLSTSVNMGILDINYIARTSKTYFIKVFEQWKPFIDYRRNDTGNKKLYIEFQTMIEKLKKDFNDK